MPKATRRNSAKSTNSRVRAATETVLDGAALSSASIEAAVASHPDAPIFQAAAVYASAVMAHASLHDANGAGRRPYGYAKACRDVVIAERVLCGRQAYTPEGALAKLEAALLMIEPWEEKGTWAFVVSAARNAVAVGI